VSHGGCCGEFPLLHFSLCFSLSFSSTFLCSSLSFADRPVRFSQVEIEAFTNRSYSAFFFDLPKKTGSNCSEILRTKSMISAHILFSFHSVEIDFCIGSVSVGCQAKAFP
jgi:hypothetical protein